MKNKSNNSTSPHNHKYGLKSTKHNEYEYEFMEIFKK